MRSGSIFIRSVTQKTQEADEHIVGGKNFANERKIVQINTTPKYIFSTNISKDMPSVFSKIMGEYIRK